MTVDNITNIATYLRTHADEIGERILSSYPALHGVEEAPSPLLSRMVRVPYPAQTLAIMGVSGRWKLARNANVVAECGAGKTLIALGSMLVHGAGRPFTGLVMAPPHLVEKWARETFLTLPQVIEEVKAQLARGRKCQVFAVYTNKHDVVERLEQLFRTEGIRASILRASVPTHRREAWYREQLRRGIDVAICHPKIVETGLDLLDFPTILFHETGYSLHTLRQSSRRSWRIGQRRPVEVKFFAYKGTMQEVCLRLMGKKLLVALAMEGKFTSEGLQAIDGDDDMLTAMARELVQNKGTGESADSVWRALGQLRPSTSAVADQEREEWPIEQAETNVPTILPMPIESIPGATLMDAASSLRRSPRRETPAGQLSLF